MDIKAKKKEEAFGVETSVLNNARELLNKEVGPDEMKTGYASICDEYEKLLDEVKFLTKVSDKLESKLNTTLEQLKVANSHLEEDKMKEKNQKEKAMEKNRQLFQEKSELDFKMNRFQLVLIVMIVALFVILLIMAYYLFIKPNVRT